MSQRIVHLAAVLLLLAGVVMATDGGVMAKDVIPARARCPVCGMFVAKYPNWVAEIKQGDETRYFDGAKDMLAYYFAPEQFGGTADAKFDAILVKDYYSLEMIDAQTAFFVVGSDVYGPMGHEFIPFASREAAEAFLKDHKGKEILTFKEIDGRRVDALRHGMRMR